MTKSQTVMVVEDDYSTRQTLNEALAFEGYEVITAANGQDGLDKIRTERKPDLILLDLMMPIMGGRQFLDEVSVDANLSPIPVFVISSLADKTNTKGAMGFMTKPIDLDAVLKTVNRFFGRQ